MPIALYPIDAGSVRNGLAVILLPENVSFLTDVVEVEELLLPCVTKNWPPHPTGVF
jgi:hypothetical protein